MPSPPPWITTLFRLGRLPFRFNKRFVLDIHTWIHFLGSTALCYAIGLILHYTGAGRPELPGAGWALLLGLLWEVGDGFKPLWYERPFGDIRDQFLRADGFSWSDLVVDFVGVLIGMIILQQTLGS